MNESREIIPFALIMGAVSTEFGVALRDLYSRFRDANIAEARHAACWVARRLTLESYPSIGRELNGRDHATVMHSVEQCQRRYEAEPEFAARLDRLLETVARLAASDLRSSFTDPDVVAITEQIVQAPFGRAATMVSLMAQRALCARLLDLEDLAGGAYQLLLHFDELERVRGGAREIALVQSTRALIDSVASLLAQLGYAPEPEGTDDHQQPDPQQETVHANATT